jgi:hypothetical protein
MKRMRSRNHRGGGTSSGNIRHHNAGQPLNRNHVFDSNSPEVRVRGTAQQLFEKYLQLGRDATSAGDRVLAESYFQHAEHYFRVLNVMNQSSQQGSSTGNGQLRRSYDGEVSTSDDGDSVDDRPPGVGDQPILSESREIPIAAAPPED